MADVADRTTDELEAALDHLRASPADGGPVQLIVRRPAVEEREPSTETTAPLSEMLGGGGE